MPEQVPILAIKVTVTRRWKGATGQVQRSRDLKSSAQDLDIVPEDPAERALEPNVHTEASESRDRNEVEAETTKEHDLSQGDLLLPLDEKGGGTDRGRLERATTSSGDSEEEKSRDFLKTLAAIKL